MVYKFRDWTLYKGSVAIDEEVQGTTYFFSRWTPNKGIPSELPEDCIVKFNERTGLPYIAEL